MQPMHVGYLTSANTKLPVTLYEHKIVQFSAILTNYYYYHYHYYY